MGNSSDPLIGCFPLHTHVPPPSVPFRIRSLVWSGSATTGTALTFTTPPPPPPPPPHTTHRTPLHLHPHRRCESVHFDTSIPFFTRHDRSILKDSCLSRISSLPSVVIHRDGAPPSSTSPVVTLRLLLLLLPLLLLLLPPPHGPLHFLSSHTRPHSCQVDDRPAIVTQTRSTITTISPSSEPTPAPSSLSRNCHAHRTPFSCSALTRPRSCARSHHIHLLAQAPAARHAQDLLHLWRLRSSWLGKDDAGRVWHVETHAWSDAGWPQRNRPQASLGRRSTVSGVECRQHPPSLLQRALFVQPRRTRR